MIKTKKLSALIMTMALLFGLYDIAQASNTSTQTVSYEVKNINELDMIGNPDPLVIDTALAGYQPYSDTDNGTTYSITTNGSNKKITAKIDSAMPEHLTLKIKLDPPDTSSISAGEIALTASSQDVVTGIGPVVASSIPILYTLCPTENDEIPPAPTSGTKTVTFTLTDQ